MAMLLPMRRRLASLEAVQLLTEAFATAMWQANQRFQSDWKLGVHGATWSFEEGHRNIAVRFRELANDTTPVKGIRLSPYPLLQVSLAQEC